MKVKMTDEQIDQQLDQIAAKDAEIEALHKVLDEMPEIQLVFKSKEDMEEWINWRDNIYTKALKTKETDSPNNEN